MKTALVAHNNFEQMLALAIQPFRTGSQFGIAGRPVNAPPRHQISLASYI